MPPRHQTLEERQAIRMRFIDAARELFVARGTEAVTMREVARRTGYSATALYMHFADKDALLRAVCDTDFLALAQSLQSILELADPVERLRVLAAAYARFALEHPNHYRLMFMMPSPCFDPLTSSIQQGNLQQDGYAQLKEMVRLAYAAGCFREDLTDAAVIAQTIWAGVHGVCSLQIALGNDAWIDWGSVENRLALMQDVLIRGLLK